MTTRTRTQTRQNEPSILYEEDLLELESLSEDELEALLFEEDTSSSGGPLNLPTLAGLSIILVGIAYIFQQLGLWGGGIDLTVLAQMLPWVAGVLIILLGFGVLSWRPGWKSRKQKKAEKKLAKSRSKTKSSIDSKAGSADGEKRRLSKSRDKKLAGVAAGIAEYFGIDPTLVRIGFVVGTVASGGGPFLLAYLILAFVMPNPDGEKKKDTSKPSLEERITIIRDS